MFRNPRRTTISDFKLVKLEIEPSKNTQQILSTLSQRVEQTSLRKNFTAITDKFHNELQILNAAQSLADSVTHILNSIPQAYQAVAPAELTGQSLLIPGLEQNLKVTRFWQSNSFYFYVMQNIADTFALLPKINLNSKPALRAQLIDDLNLLTSAIFILARSVQHELTIEQKNNFSDLMNKVQAHRNELEQWYDTAFYDNHTKKVSKVGGTLFCFSLILGLMLLMSSQVTNEKGNVSPFYLCGLISFMFCSISINITISFRIILNKYANLMDRRAAEDPILCTHKSTLYGAKNAQIIFEENISLDASYAKRYL